MVTWRGLERYPLIDVKLLAMRVVTRASRVTTCDINSDPVQTFTRLTLLVVAGVTRATESIAS